MADAELLKRLQAKFGTADNRIGGKGTPRRKRKTVHKVAAGDDKKLQAALKKLGSQPIQNIDEVSVYFESGKVLNFKSPKVQAVLTSNLFAVSGVTETKTSDLVDADLFKNMTPESLAQLKKMLDQSRGGAAGGAGDDDDIPELVENFEAAAEVTDA